MTFEFGPVVQGEMLLSRALVAIFSTEWNHLCNFGTGIMRNNSVRLF